tara:strand:+ start:101 stop:298 length:198 start_codon:yes stop_codon:yes gene_type:complete
MTMSVKIKSITIEVDGNKSVYDLQGSDDEKLETTIGAFEDVLSAHFKIDPMVNSLDIVDAVALLD